MERGEDCLHMVQLMPLPSKHPVISRLIYIQAGVPLWYRLPQIVLEESVKWLVVSFICREIHGGVE